MPNFAAVVLKMTAPKIAKDGNFWGENAPQGKILGVDRKT